MPDDVTHRDGLALKTEAIMSRMRRDKEAVDRAIENDAKGHFPADLLELEPDRQNIEFLILLLRSKLPNLDEENIKEMIASIAKADPVGFVDWRRIHAAFDYAAGRHGRPVQKLRRQFSKAR